MDDKHPLRAKIARNGPPGQPSTLVAARLGSEESLTSEKNRQTKYKNTKHGPGRGRRRRRQGHFSLMSFLNLEAGNRIRAHADFMAFLVYLSRCEDSRHRDSSRMILRADERIYAKSAK